MKKFLLTCALMLCATSIFAQSSGDNRPSPFSVGVVGFGYIPTSGTFEGDDYDYIGYGGGAGVTLKANFNRFVGLATNINYTYGSKKDIDGMATFNSKSHIFEIREALVVQYETKRDENGFVPWLSLGVGATVHNFGMEFESVAMDSATGVGFNVNVGAGVRYNFKHFYTGVSVDYSYALAYSDDFLAISGYNASNPSGVRAGVELGFRM